MRRFMLLKVIAIMAASAIAFAAPAFADDDEPSGKEAVIGIIGEVITGAIEQDQEEKLQKQCRRWNRRCEDGNDNACDQYENNCD